MALKTALIVDDSKLARITLRKKLDKLGLDVTLAESAEEAIAIIQGNRPDIIFMDHLMPEMDGFEATQEIRAMSGFENLPIVMCSGKDHETYLEEAQAIGANFTLIKPPTNDALDAIMQMDFNTVPTNNAEPEALVSAEAVAEIDDMLLAADVDDEMLISDDMDGEELVTEDAILQEREDATLLDESFMLDFEDDISTLDVVDDNPLGLEASVDIPVAEIKLEGLPIAEVIEVDQVDELAEVEEEVAEASNYEGMSIVDISLTDTAAVDDQADECNDAAEIVAESNITEDELIDTSTTQQSQLDLEQLVATSVAAAIADAKLHEQTAEIRQKQQALEDQTAILAATVTANADSLQAAEIDETAIQSIVEQVLEAKTADISATVSKALTVQLEQRLLIMSENMAQMQQRLEANESESSVLAEQLSTLKNTQLQLQNKLGLPKILSVTAILLSLAAIAGAALPFLP